MTAVSDENGLVEFDNVPSGHKYTLTETEAPEGYELTTDKFSISVDYDSITVEVTHKDGTVDTFTGEEFSQYKVVDEKINSDSTDPTDPEPTDPNNPNPSDPKNPGGNDDGSNPSNQGGNNMADTGDFGVISFISIVSIISLVWAFVIYKSKKQFN